MNNHLREAVHEYVIQKNNEKKELLKRLIKEVDDKLYPLLFPPKDQPVRFGDNSLLHVMYYSFLEPVKVMTNNVVKGLLPKMRDTHGLLTFEQFKGGEPVENKKGGKTVATVSQSNAKIRRIPR